jgi:hypothetical protein
VILSVFLNVFLDKPSKPVGPIEFSDITKDSVTLSWSPPTKDGGLPITNYIVEVKDSKQYCSTYSHQDKLIPSVLFN